MDSTLNSSSVLNLLVWKVRHRIWRLNFYIDFNIGRVDLEFRRRCFDMLNVLESLGLANQSHKPMIE